MWPKITSFERRGDSAVSEQNNKRHLKSPASILRDESFSLYLALTFPLQQELISPALHSNTKKKKHRKLFQSPRYSLYQ